MAYTLMPGEVLAMTGQAADRLLKLDHGDAALLYLHLLRHGGLEGLKWTQERTQTALDKLRSQGLAPAQELSVPEPPAQCHGRDQCRFGGQGISFSASGRRSGAAAGEKTLSR